MRSDKGSAGGGGGSGTVTSVGLALPVDVFAVSGSPVTTTGTLTGAFNSQAANTVFSGPASGVPATPTFRILVPADIPGLDASKITTGTLAVARGGTGIASYAVGDILFASGATTLSKLPIGTAGQLLQVNAGATAPEWMTSGGGTGTVTSVGLAAPAEFTVSGSPVTTTGTLTFAWATQAQNLVLSGPASGAAAAPTFRALVALDIPALDASKITTGTLAVARGGTNIGTYAVGDLLFASGTGTLSRLAIGTAGQILTVNAGATAPEWAANAGGGANRALSNLLSVAINTTLLPATSGNFDLGSTALQFANLHLASFMRIYTAASDAHPRTSVEAGLLAFGAGGGTAVDVTLERTGANVLALGSGDSFSLRGSSGTVNFAAATTFTDYALVWPPGQGGASTVLTNDGAGNLSWAAGGGGGANTALSNLAAVAVNTTLVSDTDNTDDLGTAAIGWRTLYLRTSLRMLNAASDANATLLLGQARIDFGAGGATAVDVGLLRAAANVLALDTGDSFRLQGGTSGTMTFTPAATITSYALTWPAAQGAASTVLTNDGSGVLTWAAGGGGPWQTTSFVTNLVTSTDTVTIGSAVPGGKLFIDGDDNEIQLQVQGVAGQTASLIVGEISNGNDVFTLSPSGVIEIGSNIGTGDLSVRIAPAVLDSAAGLQVSLLDSATYGLALTVSNGGTYANGGTGMDSCFKVKAGTAATAYTMPGVYFDAATYDAGDTFINKSAATGGNWRFVYDAVEILRDDGVDIQFLASRRPGVWTTIGTTKLAVFSGTMGTVSAVATVTNTTTETTLVGTQVGSFQIPASYVRVGSTFRVTVKGIYSTAVVPGTLRIRLNVQSVLVCDTGANTPTGGVTNGKFEVACVFRVNATGASGTVFGWGEFEYQVAVLAADLSWAMSNTAVSPAIAFTSAAGVDVTAQWGTADSGNSITGQVCLLEVLN